MADESQTNTIPEIPILVKTDPPELPTPPVGQVFDKPKEITGETKKRNIPEGVWMACRGCEQMITQKELDENLSICPKCQYHYPLRAGQRMESLLDPGSFTEMDANLRSTDPLKFTGEISYLAKIDSNQKKTGMKDAVISGYGKLDHHKIGIAVMDFEFLGASMGSVVGEKITRVIEYCTRKKIPVILVCASGGARMYEGMFSLMQMAKTSAALAVHAQAGLPYLTVLTNPTMAGVMASFASLGDVIIAEPQAMIGFAGARVIRETTREELPQGFQTSEFLLEHGLIDMITHRKSLKPTLSRLIDFMGF